MQVCNTETETSENQCDPTFLQIILYTWISDAVWCLLLYRAYNAAARIPDKEPPRAISLSDVSIIITSGSFTVVCLPSAKVATARGDNFKAKLYRVVYPLSRVKRDSSKTGWRDFQSKLFVWSEIIKMERHDSEEADFETACNKLADLSVCEPERSPLKGIILAATSWQLKRFVLPSNPPSPPLQPMQYISP